MNQFLIFVSYFVKNVRNTYQKIILKYFPKSKNPKNEIFIFLESLKELYLIIAGFSIVLILI